MSVVEIHIAPMLDQQVREEERLTRQREMKVDSTKKTTSIKMILFRNSRIITSLICSNFPAIASKYSPLDEDAEDVLVLEVILSTRTQTI